MPGRALPWVLAGGTAALAAYFVARAAQHPEIVTAKSPQIAHVVDDERRNAGLTYRPVGSTGEPYPAWVRALVGKSGVYVIRELQREGSYVVAYVGESHTGRLYQTLTRHFQTWRRAKRFWTGQYGGQGHDPGLTYPRHRVTVAARVLAPDRAMAEETRLIAALRPRDNLLKQPSDATADVVPF